MLIGENLLEFTGEKRKVNPEKFIRYINYIITDGNDYYHSSTKYSFSTSLKWYSTDISGNPIWISM